VGRTPGPRGMPSFRGPSNRISRVVGTPR
jgi:hypothetical protein